MYKKNLTMALGRAIASSLLGVAPAIHDGEAPLAISSINPALQLAAANDKISNTGSIAQFQEGRCGKGKNMAAQEERH